MYSKITKHDVRVFPKKGQPFFWKICACCFLCLTGCGGQVPNAQSVLINFSRSYPNLWRLVTATCYVAGFMMITKAIYHLRIYGESRTMMSSQTSLKPPITWLVVGAALIFSPTIFQVFMWTAFGTASLSPLQYTIPGWSGESLRALVGLVQLVGLFSFVRGWFLIAKGAESHAQGGGFAKGLTHIVGGLLAINIVGTFTIIRNTFVGT